MTINELPQDSLFNITSLVFNIGTRKEEVFNLYKCFYHPSQEAFCVLLTSAFSRNDMMNLIDFAKKMQIKSIILLIDRKCHDYVKTMQGMMLIGFSSEKEKKIAKIEGRNYKILTMNMKEQSEKIEEIDF